MKHFTSPAQKIGQKGERIAEMFLVKRGFSVISRNYTKKCGEIDIIAVKQGVLHFIEVKTLKRDSVWVSRETYNPFQNVHSEKLRRLANTCQVFLHEYGVSHETYWQIDVIAVTLNNEKREAKVHFLENVIF